MKTGTARLFCVLRGGKKGIGDRNKYGIAVGSLAML